MKKLSLISLEEARQLAKDTLLKHETRSEKVGLSEALGRVLACDVASPEDIPAFDRSTVDGYALRAADSEAATERCPAGFKVLGSVRMGQPAGMFISIGEAARVPTGGMIPQGADAVIMQEYVQVEPDQGNMLISRAVQPGENIINKGDDAKSGEVLLLRGRKIDMADLGVLAACGFVEVSVVKKPRVCIVGTGDEVVSPSEKPGLGQVRDVNTFTIGAMAKNCGCEVATVSRVPDDPKVLFEVLANAAKDADIVLVSGGSSVGERDYTLSAAMRLPNAELIFHGIALKPGKPTALIRAGSVSVFGIPGHIVSAMTVFREIVQPAIASLLGTETHCAPKVDAVLTSLLRPGADRDEFFYVRLETEGDMKKAVPIQGKSGWVTMLSRADGMVFLPAGHAGIVSGQIVEVRLLEGRYSPKKQGGRKCH